MNPRDTGTSGSVLADRSLDSSADAPEDPHHIFLTAREVIARYGWGRTKGYSVLRSDGFPRPIGGDRYRLDALMAWEEGQLVASPKPPSVAVLPPRRLSMAKWKSPLVAK